MENIIAKTPEGICKAAEMLNRARPAYAQIINYYQQVFETQEAAKNEVDLPEPEIPLERLKLLTSKGFPLMPPDEFQMDHSVSARLLTKICDITEAAGIQTSPSAVRLKAAFEDKEIDKKSFFNSLFRQKDSEIDSLTRKLDIDSRFIRILLYHSVKPSLETTSARLAPLLDGRQKKTALECPVCGGPPILATLGGTGERRHYCGICWHEWPFNRARCPFCQESGEKALSYIYSETEKEYRIDICETCHIYMKCIDLREIDRVIYPPLEFVATLHLDLKAQEEGYQGVPHFIF